MKVSHLEDHITHAVISGAQAIDFGISDSPEFFNILSSTLYTDQMLAVVRETLCNAWDAHIEFKCEDRFVDITLDDKYLIIRDYGPGISPKMIGPVYGTYGGSTKQANGEVTGGFGLGCKAPFAYVDDFEVTSYNEGKMSVYRLSKSNAEVGGKPSIVPVVSNIPTMEHGLQVKIAVKNDQDRSRFSDLIHRIVQNGAMKMRLNGDELFTMPFDDMTHGFMITKRKVQENFSPMNIRYGNVIYPIQREESYGVEWDDIITFLKRLSYSPRYYQTDLEWAMVLQAAPNTVSVTPSRESLSNKKHTLDTIKELMQSFLRVREKDLKTECFKLLDNRIENTWIDSSPKVLFDLGERIPNFTVSDDYGRIVYTHAAEKARDTKDMTSFSQFVKQYSLSGYPDFLGFARRDRLKRIEALIQSGFGGVTGKKLLKTYRREFLADAKRTPSRKKSKERYGSGQTVESPWFHREVVAPLIKGMNKENGLRADKLYVHSSDRKYRNGREIMVLAKDWRPHHISKMWGFARNIVVLSFNKMDVTDGDANRSALSKFWLGKAEDVLVYVTPRTSDKVQAARDYFKSKGVFLIDLTINQHKEYVQRQEEYVRTPTLKRPKKNGVPILSKMRNPDNDNFCNIVADPPEAPLDRTTTPKFVYKDGRRTEQSAFENLNAQQTKLILDTFGDAGGFCTNQNQYDRYISAGALDWRDYILDKLVEEYSTNPRIIEYLPFARARVDTEGYGSEYRGRSAQRWVKLVEADKDLREYFGLVDNRTQEDKDIMAIFKIFDNNYITGTHDKRGQIKSLISQIELSKDLIALLNMIRDSKMLQMFEVVNVEQLVYQAEVYKLTQKQKDRIRDTILFAIEG